MDRGEQIVLTDPLVAGAESERGGDDLASWPGCAHRRGGFLGLDLQ
jgi:hypothetical protein